MAQPVSSTVEQRPQPGSYREAKDLACELIARTDEGAFDAAAILDEHAQLRKYKSIALDLAYEEYCRRRERGEQVDQAEFAARFPEWQRSILKQVAMHDCLEWNPPPLEAQEVDWPEVGESFLGFDLQQLLGRGAFSRVFAAIEPELGNRKVVVKVCTTGPGEAQTHGQLSHRSIVQIYSVKEDRQRGLTAICMPLLSCVTLFDVIDHLFPRLRQTPEQPGTPADKSAIVDVVARLNSSYDLVSDSAEDLPKYVRPYGSFVDGVVEIGVQLAEAVAFTHRRGIFHSDIKPSNVLLTGSGRALLFDFNLAFSTKNSQRFVGGTLPYMAPEQLADLQTGTKSAPVVDARTDVFAIGMTLYEALCGTLPFGPPPPPGQMSQAESASELLQRHAAGLVPLVERNPQVNRSLSRVIDRCLAFAPEDRWQSAEEFAEALRKELGALPRVRRWSRRHTAVARWVPVLAALLLVLAAGVTGLRDPYPVREFKLGREAFAAEQYSAAVQHFDNAIQADGTRPEWILSRGRAYLLGGDHERALADFRSLMDRYDIGELFACLAHCHALRGISHGSEQDLQTAISLYQTAVRKGFDVAEVHNNIGFCWLEVYRAAVEKEDGSEASTSGRGMQFLDRAADALATAIARDPIFGAAWHNLTVLESYRARAAKRVPDLTIARDALRLASESAELYLDAAELFAIAATAEPATPESGEFAAEANRLMGEAYASGVGAARLYQLAAKYPSVFPARQKAAMQEAPSRRTGNSFRITDPFSGGLISLPHVAEDSPGLP